MPGPEGVSRSLVVPMYREATRVGALVDALTRWSWSANTEVILVDDGSDDGTADLVEDLIADLADARLLRLGHNQGKGGAVRAGVLSARGAVVAFADVDLSADLDEVDRCFEEAEIAGVDVVVATRVGLGSDIRVHQPSMRQLTGKFFNAAIRGLGLTNLPDTQCGLKAFRATAATALFEPLTTRGFAFDVELLVRASNLGLNVVELPIAWEHREASRVRLFHHGREMLADSLRIRRTIGLPQPASGMTDPTFDAMAAIERDHWWFTAKRRQVLEALRLAGGTGALFDVGCGTGQTVRALASAGFKPVVGSDLSRYALRKATEAVPECVFLTADAMKLPVPDATLGCVTSLDVIEHLDDDVAALREYARAAAGGLVACTVPAYAWAWSQHDVHLGHRRRYTRALLLEAVERAGLETISCRYFHHWLVAPAVLLRKTPLGRLFRGQAEASSFVNPTVNRALTALSRFEHWIDQRIDVPFGLSILVIARAPALA